MKVVWTETALDDLSEIGDFIAQDSPTRAQAFVLELFDQAEKLVDFPQSGRKFPGTRREDLRELIYEGYRLVYHLGPAQIIMIAVAEGHKLLHLDEIRARQNKEGK
jgi:toxin ParE1/3/4